MGQQAKDSPSGLGAIAPNGKLVFLPLDSVSANAWILDVSALVVITQKYSTTSSNGSLTNARYLFPIPEGASVCAFKMELTNGSVVSGVVKDTEKAKKVFQDAVSQGEWAGLAYEITADVFAISVGAIPAGQDVTIKITYATTVPDDESVLLNQIRFAIPTFIGKKRYGTAPPELSQGRSSDNSATLSFQATVQLTSKIIGITSPSHGIDVEPPETVQSRPAPLYSTTVKLRKPAPFDRDLVLSIQAEKLDAPRCVAEVDEKARTVALSLTTVPRFGAPTVETQEYVFLIDRSGSMQDLRMDYAKDALHHLIKNLPTSNTLFNIVSFGSKHSSLWGASIAYERRAVQEAEVYIDGMRSNMGGTEISSALGWIFGNRQQNTPMSVIVLTDGEVWKPEQVIALVGSEVKGASPDSPLRVFTLGIGSGASTALCEGIARVGDGVCYMTTTNEEIKERSNKLLQAARTLSHGSASGITIDWGYHSVPRAPAPPELAKPVQPQKVLGLFSKKPRPPSVVKADAEPKFVLPPLPAVLQAPPCIPNLYPGNRFIVSAILTDTVEIPQVVKLSGVLPDGSAVHLPPFKVAYTIAKPDERPPLLHTLAAHRIIRTLEDGDIGAFGLNDGGSNDMHDEIVQTAVVEYGTKYSLATRFTSFVAVRDQAKRLQPHSERTLPATSTSAQRSTLSHNLTSTSGIVTLSRETPAPPAPTRPPVVQPELAYREEVATSPSRAPARSIAASPSQGTPSARQCPAASIPNIPTQPPASAYTGQTSTKNMVMAPPSPPRETVPLRGAPPEEYSPPSAFTQSPAPARPDPPILSKRAAAPSRFTRGTALQALRGWLTRLPATTFMWHPMANLTLMATPYTTTPFDINSAPQVAPLVLFNPPKERLARASLESESPAPSVDAEPILVAGSDPVSAIARIQEYDGSAVLDDKLLGLLQRANDTLTLDEIKDAIPASLRSAGAAANCPDVEHVWATVLMAAYMFIALRGRRSVWEGLWDKAKQYACQEAQIDAVEFNDLVQKAMELLQQ